MTTCSSLLKIPAQIEILETAPCGGMLVLLQPESHGVCFVAQLKEQDYTYNKFCPLNVLSTVYVQCIPATNIPGIIELTILSCTS